MIYALIAIIFIKLRKNRIRFDEYNLDNEGIGRAIENLEGALKAGKFSMHNVMKYCLISEEILLTYMDSGLHDISFKVGVQKNFGAGRLILKIEAPELDYRSMVTEGAVPEKFSSFLDAPLWSYSENCNSIELLIDNEKRIPQTLWSLVGAIGAGCFFFACHHMPGKLGTILSDSIILPLADISFELLCMIAGLLVFFSIATEIGRIGNVKNFKSMFSRAFGRIALKNVLVILIFGASFAFIFGMGQQGQEGMLDAILGLIFGMIPLDIFSPFISGDILQVAVLSGMLGAVMLIFDDSAAPIRKICEAGQQYTVLIMTGFCRLMPVFIFLNIFAVLDRVEIGDMAGILMPVLAGCGAVLVAMAFATFGLCAFRRISPVAFLKSIMPAVKKGLAMGSTSETAGLAKGGLRKLGITEEHVDYMLPIEQLFYKPIGIIASYAGIYAVFGAFDMSFSLEDTVSIAILAFLIAITIPPVPGGVISCLTILCSQFALPTGSIGILMLIAAIMNHPGAACTVLHQCTEVASTGLKPDKADKHK